VGSRPFVERVKDILGFRGRGREVKEGAERYQVREERALYNDLFRAEKENIGHENAYFWDKNTA
jgi:hypothetical protein